MELVTLKLSDIKPYARNARKNDNAVAAVMESIKQCEYIAPIIVDENNVILAGHTRYKALKKLDYEECECVVKSGLTEEQKRKYRLLDNKTSELAEWDIDLLGEELDGLDFGDLELDWGTNAGLFIDDIIKDGDYYSQLAKQRLVGEFFSISFVFPIQYKEKLHNYIKQKGKDKITTEILKMVGA